MIDLYFDKIIDDLKHIHQSNPELSFSTCVQEAVDRMTGQFNTNIHNLNSKQIHKAVSQYRCVEIQKSKNKKSKVKVTNHGKRRG
jgi:hypothetical protein